MKSTMRKSAALATIFAASLGAAMGYQAMGGANQAGQATSVVTVNLALAMEKLDQWADAAARLRKLKDELNAEQQTRAAELEKMQEEGNVIQAQHEKADAGQKQVIEKQMQVLQERAALAALDYQAWMSFSGEKADIEAALATQDLYRSVKAAVAQMAGTNRYDVVLVDDSQGELLLTSDSRVSRVQQVQQQIGNRRILYANPVIDITDDLIQRMNNARKAAGPKAP